MSTTANPSVLERTSLMLQTTIDLLSDHELHSRDKLTPEEVIYLVQDVCIEARCKVSDLPHAVTTIYTEAHKRRDKPKYERVDFLTKVLIRDVERGLKKAV